jgi:hypothetical protein
LEEFSNNYKWYITTLKNQKWSNNIFIAKTEFLKKTILPLIAICKNNSNDKYTGLEDILINYNNYLSINDELDCIIKNYSNIKIAGGKGLFMHKDYK